MRIHLLSCAALGSMAGPILAHAHDDSNDQSVGQYSLGYKGEHADAGDHDNGNEFHHYRHGPPVGVRAVSAPEISSGPALAGITLLLGCVAVMLGRRRVHTR